MIGSGCKNRRTKNPRQAQTSRADRAKINISESTNKIFQSNIQLAFLLITSVRLDRVAHYMGAGADRPSCSRQAGPATTETDGRKRAGMTRGPAGTSGWVSAGSSQRGALQPDSTARLTPGTPIILIKPSRSPDGQSPSYWCTNSLSVSATLFISSTISALRQGLD